MSEQRSAPPSTLGRPGRVARARAVGAADDQLLRRLIARACAADYRARVGELVDDAVRGGEIRLDQPNPGLYMPLRIDVAAHGDGFIATWWAQYEVGGSTYPIDILARTGNGAGEPFGGQFNITPSDARMDSNPAIAVLANGGAARLLDARFRRRRLVCAG